MTIVARLVELVRPVRDAVGAQAFYGEALGFSLESARSGDALLLDTLAQVWGQRPAALLRLRLGRQTLVLALCALPEPDAGWPDTGGADPRFQHIAIVTTDLARAWQHVQERTPQLRSISQDGPQQLPAASGGVGAVKFRDRDGHPVELLAFPAAQVPERWHGRNGLNLGIDHSAISVADAQRSIAFYTVELGLRAMSRRTNRGREQARLDGLVAPEVDVVALTPPHAPPHLELLAYHRRPPHAEFSPRGPRTCTVWSAPDATVPRVLQDPDGHTLILLPA